MKAPIRDPDLLTQLLGRVVIAVDSETEMGMTRILGLELADGVRFPLPAGNALRSAGEIAEIRALFAGLSRQAAAIVRNQVGPGDAPAAAAHIEAAVNAALMDPDALVEIRGPGVPQARS
ncbi:MAG: hypothetical protein EA417_02610 [Gammaproteobacteria bacterium]|nr:MAG: hypothetical protein EA417_02610 [Gammaproteobacteria bacterium]